MSMACAVRGGWNRSAAALTVVAVLTLSGCGGSDPRPQPSPSPDEPASVAAGDCIDAGEGKRGVASAVVSTENVVDCDEPHTIEILAVEDFPDDLVEDDTPTEEYRESLDDRLFYPENDLEEDLRSWIRDTCAVEFGAVEGLDDIEMEGEQAVEDFSIVPMSLSIASGYEFPDESWAERPRVVCLSRYTEQRELSESADSQRSVEVTGQLAGSFLTEDFPDDLRYCVNRSATDQSLSPTDCERDHRIEYVYAFDADAVLPDELIAAIEADPANPGEATMTALAVVCAQGLPEAVGDAYDEDVVAPAAAIGSGWTSSGWWYRRVACGIEPVDPASNLGGGSIIGADEPDLAPARSQ
ncbi:MAG: hypothetical protein QM597_01985 [Aeromicrobium sp.]|uniref:hypothetical protein n=1 Tax=Aeromicrobium sp. TaxID=1871063 RepID=UPI0039E38A98